MRGRTLLLAALLGGAPASAAPWCILSVQDNVPAGPGDGGLVVLDASGAVKARLPMGERPHEVEVSRDGATAYVGRFGITDYDSKLGTPGKDVARVDLASARETGRYVLPEGLGAPHGVKLRPPGEAELFVNAEAGGDTMLVYDAASRKLLRQFPLPAATHNFVFAADGAVLFSFAGAAGVSRIDANSGKVLASAKFAAPVRGLALDGEGRVLAASAGAVYRLDPVTLAPIETVTFPGIGQLVYLAALPGGGFVAPSIPDNGVVFYTPGSDALPLVATGKTAIFAKLGPDGLVYVSNVNDTHLSVVDPRTQKVVRTIGGLDAPNGLGFGACPR